MKITQSQAEKILNGDQTFSQLGFSMLITRLRKSYAKDSSSLNVRNCTENINMFLEKYQATMIADYALISKL